MYTISIKKEVYIQKCASPLAKAVQYGYSSAFHHVIIGGGRHRRGGADLGARFNACLATGAGGGGAGVALGA